MYDGAFNRIERELRNEEGVANELDYVEQTSWVLFLKYLHDLESERSDRAELDGTVYTPIISGAFTWDKWAAPKVDGQFNRLCCTNRVRDSSRESSMVAEMHEQTHTPDLQDHELACL